MLYLVQINFPLSDSRPCQGQDIAGVVRASSKAEAISLMASERIPAEDWDAELIPVEGPFDVILTENVGT